MKQTTTKRAKLEQPQVIEVSSSDNESEEDMESTPMAAPLRIMDSATMASLGVVAHTALGIVAQVEQLKSVGRLQRAEELTADISTEQEFLSAALREIHYWRCNDRHHHETPAGCHSVSKTGLRHWGMDPAVLQCDIDYEWVCKALARRGYRVDFFERVVTPHYHTPQLNQIHVTWSKHRLGVYPSGFSPEHELIRYGIALTKSYAAAPMLEDSREYRSVSIKRARHADSDDYVESD